MTIMYYSYAKYTTSSGDTYKGFITFRNQHLIFNTKDEIIAKLNKEDISSFKVYRNLFTKNILIRVNGKDYKFQTKNKSIIHIIDFIKN